MATYKTPGVYVEEISKLPPSVAQVETALPAFIGYTNKADDITPGDLNNKPKRIGSLVEYEYYYGAGPSPTVTEVVIDSSNNFVKAAVTNSFYMYDALRMFYANGGGDCYIVSIGASVAGTSITQGNFTGGITQLEKEDAPTIILFPDAVALDDDEFGNVQKAALSQCADLQDRVGLFDVKQADSLGANFRDNVGINNLKYGAVYSPWLKVKLPKAVKYPDVEAVVSKAGVIVALADLTADTAVLAKITAVDDAYAADPIPANVQELDDDLAQSWPVYKNILAGVSSTATSMPPSGAVAGVYAMIDRTRGVWKAPANVSLNNVLAPANVFTASQLENLNVDVVAGKSVNAIRFFTGKGTLIFGARTLAGNDNEWRYVPVRRFFNMVEESTKKATEPFVFEPNDANTWVKIQGMIENFLTTLWRQGALQGAKPEHAFYVAVGLGKTMTSLDILEGRLIVEIGMAVVRPAEFIILRFSHKLAES